MKDRENTVMDVNILRALEEMLTSPGGLTGAAALFLEKNPKHPDAGKIEAFLDGIEKDPTRATSIKEIAGFIALGGTKVPKVQLS